jgi:single-stranded-DNA-specific exonuclease
VAHLILANHDRWQPAAITTRPDAGALGISPILADLLAIRGLTDTDAARQFLDRQWAWREAHWAWPELVRATERIAGAIQAGEPMAVYGDYDADGVTSSAVLLSFLTSLGADVIPYLPHRLHDGYGLSIPALDKLAAMGRKLVITVDNGVSAVAEIAHARQIGLDVIVTDHHTPPEVLPEPLAMVNPRLFDPELGILAGVGVAYWLCLSLQRYLGRGDADGLLDIVAIGSVADQVPLIGVNRHLVHRGLLQMAKTKRLGIQELLRRAGLDPQLPITARDIGFTIGPRLNAAGRLEHPQVAVDLLLAETEAQAAELANDLEALNQRRRHLTDEMTAHAHEMVRQACALDVDRFLTLWSPSWHHGVAGIVAARLVEAYDRPVLLLCQDGDVWKGSGRCPEWADLHGLLKANQEHLVRFGGHRQAAGCTVADAAKEALRQGLNRAMRDSLADLRTAPVPVDLVVPLSAIEPAFVDELAALEPLGQRNPSPRLATTGVRLLSASLRGAAGTTLIGDVTDGERSLRILGMGAQGVMPLPETVDLVYTPEWNTFRGETKLQLRLHAIGGETATPVAPTEPAPLLIPQADPLRVVDARQEMDRTAVWRQLLTDGESVVAWALVPPSVPDLVAEPHRVVIGLGDQPLPQAETLVLFDPPLSPPVLKRWLQETEAGRLLLLWPEDRLVPPGVDPPMLNVVYRQLKTLTGRSVDDVFRSNWPQGPEVFAVVWQALREAGLLLQDRQVWRLLRPDGAKIETRELPAVQRHEAMRRYWQALQAVTGEPLQAVLLGERS